MVRGDCVSQRHDPAYVPVQSAGMPPFWHFAQACVPPSSTQVGMHRTKTPCSDAAASITLRVTRLYRHEDDGWRLIRRHADAQRDILLPEAVVSR